MSSINSPRPFRYDSLNDYQCAATDTAVYPGQRTIAGLMYVALKLNGEAGEFAEHLGKALRDDALPITGTTVDLVPERKVKLVLELGDVLWYVAAAAKELGFTLGDVAQENMTKLLSRKDRGTLQGSGDHR